MQRVMANHHPSEGPFRWRAITLQRRHSDGALSPQLFKRLAQPDSDKTIPVLVWLDDGVKVNYNKLDKALAHVRGLSD
jgi:hypothetical protein